MNESKKVGIKNVARGGEKKMAYKIIDKCIADIDMVDFSGVKI